MADTNEMAAVKNNNFNSVLDLLKDYNELTISEVSEKTELSIPTVKKAIDYGLKSGMVLESSIAPSTGGRKAQLFRICEEYFYKIYFAIDNNFLICRVENFANKVCCTEKREINLSNFRNDIDYFYNKTKQQYQNINFIAISLPCVMKNGIVVDWYYNSTLNGTNFKEYLENKYKVKAVAENDMNLTVMAVGGRIASAQDKVVATLQLGHNGIGLGQMANGNVLKGHNGFAGEISFIYDLRKDVKSVKYCAKIVRNLLVFLNPEEIVFYRSDRQNKIDEIMSEATKFFPSYAIPKVIVSDKYLEDVFFGLKLASKDVLKIDVSSVKLQQL